MNNKFQHEGRDWLTIYTDGVFEARNEQDELYGVERTRILFGSSSTSEFICANGIALARKTTLP